jgi:hypothetical protein
MSSLNEKIIKMINTLTIIPSACQSFQESPCDENGEEMVSLSEECDQILEEIKKEMVALVQKVKEEPSEEVNGVVTENGIKLGDPNAI